MPLEKIVQECDATTASLFIESQANKKSKLMYTLITGASSGIGKALSLECASRGMNLLLVALPGEKGNDAGPGRVPEPRRPKGTG